MVKANVLFDKKAENAYCSSLPKSVRSWGEKCLAIEFLPTYLKRRGCATPPSISYVLCLPSCKGKKYYS